MKTLGIIISMALVASSAFGRIGETEQEVEARYGSPQTVTGSRTDELGNEVRAYKFHDFWVVVSFVKGISESETFSKAKRDEKLERKEIEAILAVYANPAVKWEPSELAIASKGFDEHTSDGRLYAVHISGYSLIVMTTNYKQQRLASAKKREEERLKGF